MAETVLSFREQRPEPGRFWIRHRPARWPGPEGPWVDLASGGLGRSRPDAPLRADPAALGRLDDLVYLPPVAAARRTERDWCVIDLLELGLPVLVQLQPGEAAPPAPAIGVWDLLPALVARDVEALAAAAAGATAVWGLVAGVTDDEAFCRRGVELLAGAGVRWLLPLRLELEPREKRLLAGDDEAAFERLFHGAPPSERAFARIAAAAGCRVRLDRPPPGRGMPRAGNRRVAARLAEIGDLWLRLGRPEGRAQELFRAARWIEEAEHDLGALAREGNLGVLSWLEPEARAQVEAALTADRPELLAELEAEYLAPAEASRP